MTADVSPTRDGGLVAPPRFVFRPVPTRRLGRSLGIDTVPLKTCNWNCVYCQLGHTVRREAVRREYVPTDEVLSEVDRRIRSLPKDAIDWITFVASGEGTLHSGIGAMIREVKRMSRHPVAVITNGSLLHLADVRAELAAADAVLPTLDAGDPDLFRRINRPYPGTTYEQHVAGLEAFARLRTRGKLWIEVMLVAGLNDSERVLRKLSHVLARVCADEVHVLLPIRCPAAKWVRAPTEDAVVRAAVMLDARVVASAVETSIPELPPADLDEEILSVITRHPWRCEALPRLFEQASPKSVDDALQRLLATRRAQIVSRYGTRFVAASASRFGRPPDAANDVASHP